MHWSAFAFIFKFIITPVDEIIVYDYRTKLERALYFGARWFHTISPAFLRKPETLENISEKKLGFQPLICGEVSVATESGRRSLNLFNDNRTPPFWVSSQPKPLRGKGFATNENFLIAAIRNFWFNREFHRMIIYKYIYIYIYIYI